MADLKRQIQEAELCIASLTHGYMNGAPPPELPLDSLLAGQNTLALFSEASVGVSGVNAGVGASGNLGESLDGPLKTPQASQECLMFLKSAQLAKSERVLHIIDFVDKLIPTSDERTIIFGSWIYKTFSFL